MSTTTSWTKLAVLVASLTLVATSCNLDWTQFGNGSGNTHSTSDSGITQANLATLEPLFAIKTGGAIYSSPSVADGIAYVTSSDGNLYAFSDSGAGTCAGTPNVCQPLWTASIETPASIGANGNPSSPAIAGTTVFVGSTNGSLEAFSADGTTNCTGTPTVCAPLWTADLEGSILSSPAVSGTTVYIGSTNGELAAYDATGVTNCTGATCAPLWTGMVDGSIEDSPAVLGTTVYVGSTGGDLAAFDAAGSTNCAGTPVVCAPLWTGATSGSITFSSPAISGGSVFIGSTNGVLSVFDAAGSTNCSGTPVVCAPLWTMTTGSAIVASPAVANNVVFIGSTNDKLSAVDATGVTNCSGTPKVCTPLWTATTGGPIRSAATTAKGMVFVGSDDAKLSVFDAAGTANCSGTPKVCTSLWSTTAGGAISSSPTVAQGTLFFGSSDGSLTAYKPWTYVRPTCSSNPHQGLSPCQLQSAYSLPSQVAGSGRTVAIVDAYDDPSAESDLAAYRAAYGLPVCSTANGCFRKLNQSGAASNYPQANSSWSIEISLDIDTVSAICPLCHIVLVEAKTNSLNNLATAENTAAAQNPTAISNSYGGAEFSGEQSLDSSYTHPGIMITVSTGDTGYGTSYPSSSPDVTAVGGTVLTPDSSVRGWTESAWSGAQSGCSSQEAKPSWQTDTLCTNRTTADVAALAGLPGESIYDSYGGNGGWLDYGGTSLSAPIIASVYALAYPDSSIATTYANGSLLYDVTSGSNGTCGGTYLCAAGTGYDGPTGLGTPCGTAGFGTGPFATASCVDGVPTTATPSAAPQLDQPMLTEPNVVLTPVCGTVAPGYARCNADRISPAG